jgi:hypothetical protein
LIYVGKRAKLVVIIDNATWHNQPTEDTILLKRAWRKELIVQWLVNHNIIDSVKTTKAELLVLAFDNLPPKRDVIDEVANKIEDIFKKADRFTEEIEEQLVDEEEEVDLEADGMVD